MKVFVIEIIQSPVGWIKLLLISFFTYRSGICVLDKSESDARLKFAVIEVETHSFIELNS